MAQNILNIYNRSPNPLRTIIATGRGLYLHWWRYNSETKGLVTDALSRDYWNHEEWQTWQTERLSEVLRIATMEVPYYRDYWRRRADVASWRSLNNWPILKKEKIRENPEFFLVEGTSKKKLFELHTSGTTGKPLRLWRSRNTNINWYALFEARWRRWYGVTKNDRWAILGGQLVTPFSQNKPPYWIWNAGLRQLYMSSYHITLKNLPSYLDALYRYNVEYILGYASSLYSLAYGVLDKDLKVPRLKVVLSNAEPMFEHQKNIIKRAFRCPVRDTYGMTEIVAAASECENKSLHLWPDAGIVEVFDLNKDILAKKGQQGRLVCTGLINKEMPLIRYEIGDIGVLAPSSQMCNCGRTLPILNKIEGRLDDVIITEDGRRIGRLDPVFKGDLPIIEAQIIQENFNSLRVRYVSAPGFKKSDKKNLIERIKDRVGDMKIGLEPVDKIPRTASGKYQAVISKVSKREI